MPEQSEIQSPKVYEVFELTELITALLEKRFDFIWVEGEISNFSAPRSGHYYMVLKDDRAQIRSVMFRMQARYLKFIPENGMKVLAQGRIGVYAPRGEYQLILDYLEPIGSGALALAFEQVKQKLAKQGLFDPSVKKPLPFLPKKIALVTSPTGAAVRDFLKVVERRFANLDIAIIPVRVQGDQACGDMVQALEFINQNFEADVIVLTRGGGSLEDLWPFNQEALAVAIRGSKIPVVSAVGHEIDLTISDMAADFRAPTPSAAAELLVVEKEAMEKRVQELKSRLANEIQKKVLHKRDLLAYLKKRLQDPRKRLNDAWIRLDMAQERLTELMGRILDRKQTDLASNVNALKTCSPLQRITTSKQGLAYQAWSLEKSMQSKIQSFQGQMKVLERSLAGLNPHAILKRGYSITYHLPEREIMKNTSTAKPEDQVMVVLGEGHLMCRVEKIESGDRLD